MITSAAKTWIPEFTQRRGCERERAASDLCALGRPGGSDFVVTPGGLEKPRGLEKAVSSHFGAGAMEQKVHHSQEPHLVQLGSLIYKLRDLGPSLY